jgi:hypothetical protein
MKKGDEPGDNIVPGKRKLFLKIRDSPIAGKRFKKYIVIKILDNE